MKSDNEGFLFPVISEEHCTDCKACIEKCAFQRGYGFYTEHPKVYAVKHKDESVRASSTSGGLFTAISDYILGCGGVVFGAKSDENHKVIHACAHTPSERDDFRGSKYVKSDLGNCFIHVRKFLNDGIPVLFSGTPCQTAALNSYIGEHEKLVTTDFICHGTPSQLMLDEYIRYVQSKEKKKIKQHYHRIKDFGWHNHIEANVYEDGKIDYISLDSQLYRDLFYSNLNLNLNLNCYNCKYTNFRRPSDLTMGDFWGIEECLPDFDDNKGVSLCLINSIKGEQLFSAISNTLEIRECNENDCSKKQLHLSQPNKFNPRRDDFWKDYHTHGFEYTVKKYIQYKKKDKLIVLLKIIGLYRITKNVHIRFSKQILYLRKIFKKF